MKALFKCLLTILIIYFTLLPTWADEYRDTQEIKGTGEIGYLGRGLFLGLRGEYKDPGTIGGEASFYYLIPEKHPYGLLVGRLTYDFTGFGLGLGGSGYFSEGGVGVGPSVSLRIGPKDFFYLSANYDSTDTFTRSPFTRLSLGAGAQASSGSHLWIGYSQEGWAESTARGNGSFYSARLEQETYEIFRFFNIDVDWLKELIALIEVGFRPQDGGRLVLNLGAGYKWGRLTGDSLATQKLAQAKALEDSGNLDGATPIYREVMDGFPDTRYEDEARFRLSEIRRRSGRREEAESSMASLKELAEKFPESIYDARLRYQQGADAVGDGKWIEAYRSFESLIAKYPDDPLAKEAEYWVEYILGILTNFDRVRLELVAFLDNYSRGELSDDAQYRIARSYYDQGDYHRAIEAYDRLFADFPESELLWLASYDKGLAYQNLGDWERALDSYLGSLSLVRPGLPLSDFEASSAAPSARLIADGSSVHDRLNYRIGNAYWNLGEFEKSIDAFLKVDLTNIPQGDSDDLGLKLGYAYFNLGDYARALERLQDAIAKAGDPSALPPVVTYMVGRSHEALGALDRATSFYRLFLDRNPGDLMFDEARMRLGYTQLKAASYSDAFDNLLASLREAGDEPVRMDLRYRIGYIYHKLEAWGDVIDSYEGFLRDYGDAKYDSLTDAGSPYYPGRDAKPIVYKNEVLLRLGDAYFSTAQYAKTLGSYLDLLGRTEDATVREHAQYRVGFSYDQLQKWAEAVEAYETFLAAHPASALVDDVRLRLGFVYFHVADYEQALAEFQYSLTKPYDEETLILLEYKVGQTLERLGRWEEALAFHQEFTAKHPEDILVGNALAGIGDAYRNLGRPEEAMKAYREATARYPASPTSDDAQLNIGRIYLERGDYTDALVELQKVLKYYPQRDSTPEAELLVGKTFRRLGDNQRALGVLNEVIIKYPQNAGIVEEAQREIAEIQRGAS